MSRKNFLFLLRTDPDIDHIAPLIWKCLEEGQTAFVTFLEPFRYDKDYRIQFLTKYPNFRVLQFGGVLAQSRSLRLASRFVWNFYTVASILRRRQIAACFFEWGEGVTPLGAELPLKRAVLRFIKDLRVQVFRAATSLSIPTICLPHGLNTKLNLDTNPYVSKLIKDNGGELPFEDRNLYSVYVFNTEYHRESYVKHARMSAKTSRTWGSLRFCPQWMTLLDCICPKANLTAPGPGQSRLLFFLPKWHNRVHKEETVRLIKSLAGRADIQLLLKTHPRKGEAEFDSAWRAELENRSNVVLITSNQPSHALIEAADIVIDVGSSIAIEAILQKKHVIYPKYLHENRLVLDEYGGCLMAVNLEEVHRQIDRIVSGTAADPLPDTAPVIKQTVYGGREPFDVPDYYYSQILQQLN